MLCLLTKNMHIHIVYIRHIVKLFFHVIKRFHPLGPNILLRTLFSNTPTLCSSHSVRDQVSNQYRTAGKLVVLYILISISF